MRKLLILFGIVLVTVAVLFPVSSKAAGKKVCQILKESKTYQYNLDQKGKKESIRVDIVSRKKYEMKGKYGNRYTAYDVKAVVTINGKPIYTKVAKERYYMSEEDYLAYVPIKVLVTDIDKKDKQMELMIFDGACVVEGTDTIEHIYYYQYANGKVKRKQDLVSLFQKSLPYVKYVCGVKDSSILSINEKNEISAGLRLDIPNLGETFFFTKAYLILKNGKFIQKNQKLYRITWMYVPIRMKNNMVAYTSPGGKEVAFNVKKRGKINICNIYVVNKKKLYLKIKSNNGKTGYIDPKKASSYVDERDLGPDSDYYD